MKHFLLIAATILFACCFGSTLYGQAPCCSKPASASKAACTPAAAGTSETSKTAMLANAPSKACAGQSAEAAPAVRPTGVLVANAQTGGTTAKAACDISKCLPPGCDPTKCDISKCLPPGCDLSKCSPGKEAATEKNSKSVRL